MKNEQGLTLIEVVASLVIITIILLSFSSIFISNNKHANTNTEKLVVVHLADAQLERLKVTASKIDPTSTYPNIEVNNKTYAINVKATQTIDEEKMGIQNVVVTVSTADNKLNTSVEGYVVYE